MHTSIVTVSHFLQIRVTLAEIEYIVSKLY